MNKPFLIGFIVFTLAILLIPKAHAASGEIHVLLGTASEGTISGTVMSAQTKEKCVSLSGSYKVRLSGGKLRVGPQSMPMPVTISSPQPILWNGERYHGRITFSQGSGCFAVGNKVDIELYLCGVLRAEMHYSWHPEALKAQAIIARTYAMKNMGAHGAFDLCASVHCQEYKGISNNDANLTAAVMATKGLVLRYNGDLASTFYHSDSGGMVTRSGSVWSSDLPYLQSRAEPASYTSPNTTWEVTVPMSQIQSMLSAVGISVGMIQSVTPIRRDESGRVEQLEIRGSSGMKRITGHKFRTLLGSTVVKSTLFEFVARSPYNLTTAGSTLPAAKIPPGVSLSQMPQNKGTQIDWMAENRIFTTQELMEILSHPDLRDKYIELGIARVKGEKPIPVIGSALGQPAQKAQTPQTAATGDSGSNLSMTPATGTFVTFYGRGYGHGVGLSQWGAKALAEEGWSYDRILTYYFPGTSLAQ